MTAAQNVAYGLEARGTPRTGDRGAGRGDAGAGAARRISPGAIQGKCPAASSSAWRWRGRLAVRPAILLLDEPFAALDKNLRLDMQIEIKRIQRLSGTTTLIVTHDQEEALSMADRVAVFNQGRLEQFGTPGEIYDRPRIAVRQHLRRRRQSAAQASWSRSKRQRRRT